MVASAVEERVRVCVVHLQWQGPSDFWLQQAGSQQRQAAIARLRHWGTDPAVVLLCVCVSVGVSYAVVILCACVSACKLMLCGAKFLPYPTTSLSGL